MTENSVVRARIDERTQQEAAVLRATDRKSTWAFLILTTENPT
jgi:hypothetical protein